MKKNKDRIAQLERDNAALAERLERLEADRGTKTNYNKNVRHIPNYWPYYRQPTWIPYVNYPMPYWPTRIYCASTGTSIGDQTSNTTNNAL